MWGADGRWAPWDISGPEDLWVPWGGPYRAPALAGTLAAASASISALQLGQRLAGRGCSARARMGASRTGSFIRSTGRSGPGGPSFAPGRNTADPSHSSHQ